MIIKTKDKIVQQVLAKMDARSLEGQKKYGSTMHDEVSTNKKDLRDFLVDVQEEIMDALLYIEAAKACLQEEIEELYIKDRFEPVKIQDPYPISQNWVDPRGYPHPAIEADMASYPLGNVSCTMDCECEMECKFERTQ